MSITTRKKRSTYGWHVTKKWLTYKYPIRYPDYNIERKRINEDEPIEWWAEHILKRSSEFPAWTGVDRREAAEMLVVAHMTETSQIRPND